ncbi:flexible cuticle protein 12-like [Phlebotomus argentipes]|uniref:flexible cuticle protein 12-like n=1 Tax=Phlebotomus argentipes TaxID=94469 RepID=UPI0028934588|nr:flexible cuticle protein 12-like [Phlebotomus argentipes]
MVKSLHFFAVLFLTFGIFTVTRSASIFGDDDEDSADPEPIKDNEVKVLFREDSHTETGYKYVYELSDGTGREEVGTIHNRGTDQEYLEVAGFYRYTGPDKYIYRVDYTSGPQGYQAMTSRYHSKNRISPVALKSLVG